MGSSLEALKAGNKDAMKTTTIEKIEINKTES